MNSPVEIVLLLGKIQRIHNVYGGPGFVETKNKTKKGTEKVIEFN